MMDACSQPTVPEVRPVGRNHTHLVGCSERKEVEAIVVEAPWKHAEVRDGEEVEIWPAASNMPDAAY